MLAAANILLVDDDGDLVQSLARALKVKLPQFAFQVATSTEKALQFVDAYHPLVIVQDLSLDEKGGAKSGLDLLYEIQTLDPTVRVIILTGHGSLEHGIKAIQAGAASFLEKPADIDHLSVLIEDCAKQTGLKRKLFQLSKREAQDFQGILGESDAAKQIREAVSYAAQTSQAVLITGETGTGKGLVARAIHNLSPRSTNNFVRYQPNFGTADLVASELFGHIKGAFTGADYDRRGLITDADKGTLFLDEIDELPLPTQVTLLHVLQEKCFRAVGSNKVLSVDFRLISATNQDIERSINSAKLRADLFHRIGHFKIHLPPLRERISDIQAITKGVLNNLRERERVNIFDITTEALEFLQRYGWPGNVRELEAVIESAAYLAQFRNRSVIESSDLKLGNAHSEIRIGGFNDQVEQFKATLINQALAKHAGNQVKAARELGIDRATVKRVITRVDVLCIPKKN